MYKQKTGLDFKRIGFDFIVVIVIVVIFLLYERENKGIISSLFGITLGLTCCFEFLIERIYAYPLREKSADKRWPITIVQIFIIILFFVGTLLCLADLLETVNNLIDKLQLKKIPNRSIVYVLVAGHLGGRLAFYIPYIYSYIKDKKWFINNKVDNKDNIEAIGKENIEATGKENINKTMLVAKILGCQRQKDNNSILEFELEFSEGEGNRKKELIKLDTRDLDPKIKKINPQNFKDKMIIAMPKSENCEGVIMTVINDGKLKLLSVTKDAKPGDKVS